ncbi:MAG: hypothetical protein K9L22_02660 [Methylococcaceae bacterium]|nr:hypothetical protein [Methylococcaceae bacterium]
MRHVTLFLTLYLTLLSAYAEPAFPVSALISSNSKIYQQVLDAMVLHAQNQQKPIKLSIHIIDQETTDNDTALLAKIKAESPLALLSLGSAATRFAVKNFSRTPICAALIVDDSLVKNVPNATAIVLNFPVKLQLEWLKKIAPHKNHLAVFYNPEKNQTEVQQLQRLAGQYAVTIHPYSVSSTLDLVDTLKHLSQQIDVLWSFPDTSFLNPQSAKQLLLYSFRNRIPLIGVSEQWTKAGALYALDRDYSDIGRQCNDKLQLLAQGVKAKNIAISIPEKVYYSINERTFEHMKIDLPASLKKGAFIVF